MAASRTVRANGPAWSSEDAYATMPKREQRPYVGLMPTMPVSAAGWRIEPPVSVPTAPRQRPGDTTGPKYEVSFDEPMANSSLLSLPGITAPSRHRLAVTVDS